MRALAFLFILRAVNAVRRGLRQPRVLLPALLVVAFVALQVWGFLLLVHANGRGVEGATPIFTRTDLLLGGPGAFLITIRGVLLFALLSSFLAALGDGALFFTPSDVDFLFPAPLSRRLILLWRMASRYLGNLLPAIYVPLALGGASLAGVAQVSPLRFWPGFLGAWFYLTTVSNFAQVVLLNRADGSEDEVGWARRRAWRRVLGVCLIVLIVGAAYLGVRYITGEGIVDVGLFARAVNSDAVNHLLLPDAWASDLFGVGFTGWTPADIVRLTALTILAAASFFFLFSRERDFYEQAMYLSARMSRMADAMRSGDAGTIFSQMAQEGQLGRGRSVRPLGTGAWAIFWKDCVSVTRTPPRSWVSLLFLATLPALVGGIVGRRGDINILFWNGMFTLQMAGFFLLSLRDMLRRADITKALPIEPWKLIAAELALSVAQLTLLGWCSLGVLTLTGMGQGPLLAVAAVTLPTLAGLLLSVQTAFVLLYPDTNDPAQHWIGGLLSLVASVLSLLPSLTLGIMLYQLGVSLPAITVGIAGVNLTGTAIALVAVAHLWKRFDPTN